VGQCGSIQERKSVKYDTTGGADTKTWCPKHFALPSVPVRNLLPRHALPPSCAMLAMQPAEPPTMPEPLLACASDWFCRAARGRPMRSDTPARTDCTRPVGLNSSESEPRTCAPGRVGVEK